MIIPVASIGYNRPEMQELSLKYLLKCPEAKQTPLYLCIDGGMSKSAAERMADRFKGSFDSLKLIYRDKRIGLSKNILFAIRHLFEKHEFACILEDDVLCAVDFLRFHHYIQTHFNLEQLKVFSVTGYAKRPVTTDKDTKSLVGALNLRTWYSPDGVVFTKQVWKKIEPHVKDAYFSDPRSYLDQFRVTCKRVQPRFEKATWLNNRHNSVLQAGMLNTLRASWGMYSVIPEISRCQDIGVYGTNHPQKTNKGENIKDETFWRTGGWYSDCFKQNNEWDALYIHKVEGMLSSGSIDRKGE